ncbi:DUF6925 family protein [Mesorhizobium amorphae]|uniref:DUF6925 family protein n=1 Tax=Mesorhizobium amorphae TaxID=71433 RepID=UPI00118226C6|nr:hypothetical protein [Mesorhizobium amorphae]
MTDLEPLLQKHLGDWRSGWSMGSFGAIAEFHQDADEQPVIDEPRDLTRATRRGAIRLERRRLVEATAVAYETLSPKRHRWSHAVALCLPEARARRNGHKVLTEIGPDDDAIRGIDRTGILFDMGLGLPQCDFCIRTSDPKLLGELRANLGRSLFEPGNGATAAIMSAHPHRVALTALGRVEVYQKIGGPDTGGVSPAGPHTHLLPKLLASGRTHSANTPIPHGLLPLAFLHPGNPVIDPMGQDQPFDLGLHEAFQNLLNRYGAAEARMAKQAIGTALSTGVAPQSWTPPLSRTAKAAARIALRQEARLATLHDDARRIGIVTDWQVAFDQLDPEAADGVEDEAPGH